jgi:hypothetical protein
MNLQVTSIKDEIKYWPNSTPKNDSAWDKVNKKLSSSVIRTIAWVSPNNIFWEIIFVLTEKGEV